MITVSIDGSTPITHTVTAAEAAAPATPISVLLPATDITAAGQGPATITTTYADAAGNPATGTPLTTNLTIDTQVPTTPTVDALSTNDTTPSISGVSEQGATITIYDTDGTTVLVDAHEDENQGTIVTNVVNFGSQIAPSDRLDIFRRFVKGKTGPGTESGGTGLGLSIARWAAQLHGGTVKVVDDTRGADFEIILPKYHIAER